MPYQQQDNLCKYGTHVKVALTMGIFLLLLNDKLQLAGQQQRTQQMDWGGVKGPFAARRHNGFTH